MMIKYTILLILILVCCHAAPHMVERHDILKSIDQKLLQSNQHVKPYKIHYNFPLSWLQELDQLKGRVLRKLLLSTNKDIFYAFMGETTLLDYLYNQLFPNDFFPLSTVKFSVPKPTQLDIFSLMSMGEILQHTSFDVLKDKSIKVAVNLPETRGMIRDYVMEKYGQTVVSILQELPELDIILPQLYNFTVDEASYTFLHDTLQRRHDQEEHLFNLLQLHPYFTPAKLNSIAQSKVMERRIMRLLQADMERHIPPPYFYILMVIILGRRLVKLLEDLGETVARVDNDPETWVTLIEQAAIWLKMFEPEVFETTLRDAEHWEGPKALLDRNGGISRKELDALLLPADVKIDVYNALLQ